MGIVYDEKYKLYHIRGKYKDENGAWRNYEKFMGSKGFKGKKEARKADEEFRQSMEGIRSSLLNSQITIDELWNTYKNEKKNLLKASTLQNDEDCLVVVGKQIDGFSNYKIALIKEKTIQDFFNYLDSKEYSLNYIKKIYTTLNKLFNYAVKKRYIKESPMQHIEMIKRPNKVVDKTIKFWTPEQFSLFIENVDDDFYFTLFSFLYNTGCRLGEALALTWNDIDLDKNTFHIKSTCVQELRGIPYLITPPKTKNSIRKHKMPKNLNTTIKRWYTDQSNKYNFNLNCFVFGMDAPKSESTVRKRFNHYNFYFDGWVPTDKIDRDCPAIYDVVTIIDGVLYNDEEGYRKIRTCRKPLMIDKIKPDAKCMYHVTMGLPDLSLHDLRHSLVSLLINKGVNIKAIADYIGDTVDQVLKTYAHLFDKTEEELINAIDIALS